MSKKTITKIIVLFILIAAALSVYAQPNYVGSSASSDNFFMNVVLTETRMACANSASSDNFRIVAKLTSSHDISAPSECGLNADPSQVSECDTAVVGGCCDGYDFCPYGTVFNGVSCVAGSYYCKNEYRCSANPLDADINISHYACNGAGSCTVIVSSTMQPCTGGKCCYYDESINNATCKLTNTNNLNFFNFYEKFGYFDDGTFDICLLNEIYDCDGDNAQGDAQCWAGGHCTAAGVCEEDFENSQSCTRNGQCKSGQCISGKCYDSRSLIANLNEIRNTSVYLLMRVQYWNATASAWQTVHTILDDTEPRQIEESSYLKLDDLWNAVSWSTSSVAAYGMYRAYVVATDENNNVLLGRSGDNVSASYNFTITAGQGITLVSPVNNTKTGLRNITFKCSVLDIDGIQSVELWSNLTGAWAQTGVLYPLGATSYSAEFDVNNITPGNYRWNCMAIDNNSDTIWAEANYTLEVENKTTDLICLVTTASECSSMAGLDVVYLSAYSNARGELYNVAHSYSLVVCCKDSNLGRTCSDEHLFNLSLTSGGYAKLANVSGPGYPYKVCLSSEDPDENLTCIYRHNQECNASEFCVVELTNYTNALMGDCLAADYDYKICCKVEPVLDLTPPKFNLTKILPNISITTEYNQTDIVPLKVSINENATVKAVITLANASTQLLTLAFNGTEWYYKANFTNTYPVGIYNVTFNATDLSNNSNTTKTSFKVNDITSPRVIIMEPLYPSNWYYNNVTVIIRANVTDPYYNSIDTVLANVSFNNTYNLVNLSWAGGVVYYIGFTNTTYAGIYNVTIIANDTSGNLNNSEKTWFNVSASPDTDPPIFNLSVLQPNGSVYNQTDIVPLLVSINEQAGINGVKAFIDYPNGTSKTVILGYNGTQWYYKSSFTDTLSIGLYNVTFNATDLAGNSNTTKTNFTVQDITGPDIIIIYPVNGTLYQNSSIVNITVNATDPYYDYIDTVLANITWNISSQIVALTEIGNTQQFTGNFTNSTYEGRYNVTVFVNDTSGNANTAKAWFNVTALDTEPPIFNLSVLQPNGSVYNQTDIVPLLVSINENATVKALINYPNATSKTITLSFNGTEWYYKANFTETYPIGLYAVTYNATDLSNNSNTTAANFTVQDVTDPIIKIINPVQNEYYLINSVINITVNATDPYYDYIGAVLANITWSAGSKTIVLNEIGNTQQFTGNFTNTTEYGRYNLTITANDTSSNKNSNSTWFNVFNCTLLGNSSLNNSICINSVLNNSIKLNSTIIGSINSNCTVENSTEINVSCVDSNIINCQNISYSALAGSLCNSSYAYGSNMTGSNITNSELYSCERVENSVLIDIICRDSTIINSTKIRARNITNSYNYNCTVNSSPGYYINENTVICTNSVVMGNSSLEKSTAANSLLYNVTVMNNSLINNSDLTNCLIINGTVKNKVAKGCIVINAVVDPDGVKNNLTGTNVSGSEIYYSNVIYSEVRNQSKIWYSNVSKSVIINSTVIDCYVFNSTIINSVKINSTIVNSVINNSNNTDCNVTNRTEVNITCLKGYWCGDNICEDANLASGECSFCAADCTVSACCGNGRCDSAVGENDDTCKKDCEKDKGAAGGGGGGGFLTACYENWNCTEWGSCQPNGTQTRECHDINSCDVKYNERIIDRVYFTKRPELVQTCTYISPKETCYDGIKNQDETDVDCGGLVCAKCQDGKNCITDDDCINSCGTTGVCYTPPVIEAPAPPAKRNIWMYLGILAAAIAVLIGGAYAYFNLDKFAFYQRYMERKQSRFLAERKEEEAAKGKLMELERRKAETVKELHKRLQKEYADKIDLFLDKAVEKGYKKTDIKNALVAKGWPESFVNKYINKYFKEHHIKIRKLEKEMEKTPAYAKLEAELENLNKKISRK